jgi:hypothetical protein
VGQLLHFRIAAVVCSFDGDGTIRDGESREHVSNVPGSQGLAISVTAGTSTITASYGSIKWKH